jgi:hypothetical protein
LKDEEDPAEVTAGSIFAAGVATDRLAFRCIAIVSAESGALTAVAD